MGIWASRAWRRAFSSDQQCKIVIVGLNNAGKTTILYNLHLGQVVMTQPTIGSNVEEVKHENITFQVWDLGGQEVFRANWATYFEEGHAPFRNAGEIAQDLSLHKILTHEWQIQSCCALTGAGLREGLSWIAGRIKARRAGNVGGEKEGALPVS
eukprot:g15758.t1